MNRKPITKANVTSTKAKPKASTVPKTSPPVETEIFQESFRHSCTTQHFALVWLDENYDQNNSNCRTLVTGLQTIIKKIDVFNDTNECIKFIKAIHNQDVYLIISNPDEKALTRTHQTEQVSVIFIFDDTNSSNESWPDKLKKVQGIYLSVEALCASVKNTAKQSDNEYNEIRFISSNDIEKRDLNELDQSFMYTQLIKEILLELKYDDACVQELVTHCNDNRDAIKAKLHGLGEFQKNYKRNEKAVWWYTKEIFTYHLVNWALREQEFDTIIRVGFFINDLHRHIAELHQAQISNRKDEYIVYRGQGMSKERFTALKESVGGLLAFNSFLSTSKKEQVARGFLGTALTNGDPIGLLFMITVSPLISSAVYADVTGVSFYEKNEAEVLFSFATIFRIQDICLESNNPEVWIVKLQLTSDEDRKLNIVMDRMRNEIEGSTPLYKLGALMIKVGQYNKAEEVYLKLMKDATNNTEMGNIYHQFGFTKYKQGNPRKALEAYQRALNLYLACFGNDHANVAAVYNNMGLAYDSLEDQSQALICYQEAQHIYEKSSSANSSVLATCYNNIASIYDQQQDYEQALLYFNKSSEMYNGYTTSDHPDFATLKNNIGLVHLKKNEYKKAIECFQEAVKIGRKALPPDHADLLAYQKHLDNAKTVLDKYK
ncbi:unnamed protein product [Adineta ricciae]|uniref:Uncharacterized protein n=1 Tax=Adineta ricciae TaxID=249248 RepID=A0A814NIR1_ADIRI|nr:unnamed protein product [Adineta ricciae]CAF1250931.1 unnamed protein product [Adineta ricciae]